jgi:protein-S-isoprenylcysteine O-methyltransferase Ste14
VSKVPPTDLPLRVLEIAILLWWVSWRIASRWSAPAVHHAGWSAQAWYQIVVVIGGALLFGLGPGHVPGTIVLWQLAPWLMWTACGVGIAGLLFTWWARLHLGRLWSRGVTRKADHHIVDTGPYGIVRHPIYTGVTLAGIAVAIICGTLGGFAGAAVLTWGWYLKARLEERFLREQLGADPYNAYARQVPMLVPFWRPSHR